MRVIAMFAVVLLVVLLGVQYGGRIRAEERRVADERAAFERDSLQRWFVAESTRAAVERDSIRAQAAKWQDQRKARRDSVQRRVECARMRMNGTKSMAC